MNKEEIEEAKECLNEVIQNTYAEGKAIKLDYLRKYIESLELTLEQKESILDKVKEKLKEVKRELKDDGYDYYAKEITKVLNIIEGEKK